MGLARVWARGAAHRAWWTPAAAAALLACAAYLRFHDIERPSFWFDEIWTAVRIESPSVGGLWDDIGPIGRKQYVYYALGRSLARVVDDPPMAMRFLSAGAGTLLVFGMFLLGRLLFNRRVGLLAMAMATFSAYLIHYSQEARCYALLLACLTFFAYQTVKVTRAIRQGHALNPGSTIVLALLLVGSGYLHFSGVAAAAGVTAACIASCRSDRRSFRLVLGLNAALFCLFLPLGFLFLEALRPEGGLDWSTDVPTLASFRGFVRSFWGGSSIARLLGTIIVIWLIGRWRAGRSFPAVRGQHVEIGVLLAWILVPVAAAAAISVVFTSVWVERYLSVIVPGLLLLSAASLAGIASWTRAGTAVVVMGTLGFIVANLNAPKAENRQFREATQYLRSSALPGEDAAATLDFQPWSTELWDWYLRREGTGLHVEWANVVDDAAQRERLRKSSAESLWALADRDVLEGRPLEALLPGFIVTDRKEFSGVVVYHLRRSPPREPVSSAGRGSVAR